jgi:hypothetical protein
VYGLQPNMDENNGTAKLKIFMEGRFKSRPSGYNTMYTIQCHNPEGHDININILGKCLIPPDFHFQPII